MGEIRTRPGHIWFTQVIAKMKSQGRNERFLLPLIVLKRLYIFLIEHRNFVSENFFWFHSYFTKRKMSFLLNCSRKFNKIFWNDTIVFIRRLKKAEKTKFQKFAEYMVTSRGGLAIWELRVISRWAGPMKNVLCFKCFKTIS